MMKNACALVIFMFVCASSVIGKPVNSKIVQDELTTFLRAYGYLNKTEIRITNRWHSFSTGDVENAIKNMQKYGGLRPTGKVNEETIRLMKTTRCGYSDKSTAYTVLGNPWNKRQLTYSIYQSYQHIPMALVTKSVERAMRVWAEYSGLTFTRATNANQADIKIAFNYRYHGDNNAFDGAGGVLAHAYAPGQGIGGDVHFDVEEPWDFQGTQNQYRSVNFYQVLLHELGHSLGLGHSQDPNAVMYAYYRGGYSETLTADDIRGIRDLYGRRNNNRWFNY